MKNLLMILISPIILVISACNTTVTEKSLSYADNLKDAIEKFETSRKDVAQNVATAAESTTNSLSQEKPNVSQAAKDWEMEWNSIMTRFSDLENNFSLVGQSSVDYFAKLDELSSSIENEKLRNSELLKNKELKDKYALAYDEASNNIAKIKQVLKEGGDYHKVLVASSMRQKINQNIDELKLISENAKQILDELEKFTIEGKKLISTS